MSSRTFRHGITITPDNNANNTIHISGLLVGNTGNVNCILFGDTANTLLVNLTAGVVHDLSLSKVWSTGTTANNIVGFN